MDSSRMQSSPPQSTSPKYMPSSPNASQYELDLDALGSSSLFSSPVAKPEPIRVLSEDIDGPSDFTVNMIDWLKGRRLQKDELVEDTMLEPPVDEATVLEHKPDRLQPTVEDYQSELSHARTPVSLNNTRAPTLRQKSVAQLHPSEESVIHRPPTPPPKSSVPPPSTRGTTGRPGIGSSLRPEGGASEYLMGQLERLSNELAAEKQARAADKATHAAEISEYHSKLQLATKTITRFQKVHEAEVDRIRSQHAEDLETARQSSTRDLERKHAAEIQRLRTAHAASLRATTDSAAEAQTSIAAEVQRLVTSQQSSSQAAAATAEALRSAHAAALRSVRQEHEDETAARDVAMAAEVRAREERLKKQLSTANSQREKTEQELSAAEVAIEEQDAEIKALTKKLHKMEKLNKAMGKELMRAWGREECGDTGERQEYRYKFVKA